MAADGCKVQRPDARLFCRNALRPAAGLQLLPDVLQGELPGQE
jgi:hypothetical protein